MTTHAQELVTQIEMPLKKDNDVFQIVDEGQKQVALFVSDKNKVKTIMLDENLAIKDSLSAARPHSSFKDMAGFAHEGQRYNLFWSTTGSQELISQSFDFMQRSAKEKKYSISFKNEKIIQEFSENNHFYILTALKNSNVVKLYTFYPDGRLENKTLEFKNFHFFTPDYQRTNFYGLFEGAFYLKRIHPESPTSLTDAAAKDKFYFADDKIVMTFDRNVDYTQVILIDMQSWTATEQYIRQAFVGNDRSILNSNSFLMGSQMYQVKISPEIFAITIKTLDDRLVKEHKTSGSFDIGFRNSDIIQENGDIDNTRILDKTSQYLRKINSAQLAISCYAMGDNVLATVGSVTEPQNNAVLYGAMFGAVGVMAAYALSNPVMDNFNAYNNRKVVYVNCLFDLNGNHVPGAVPSLAFDKIRKFVGDNKNLDSETLFKLNSAYYLGAYISKEKRYEIRKFTE
jgi:hypothetical protein